MKKPNKPHANHERWLVSYADFMTLLFAFFVVLYSSSQVDKARMASLSGAITAGFSGLGIGSGAAPLVIPGTAPVLNSHLAPSQPDTETIRRKLETDLSSELQRHIVAIRTSPEGLVLSLREVGFFDSGSATLHATSMDTFDRIRSVIASTGCYLRIEGHTDNVPINTLHFHSNWELSTSRATEIIRIFITRENIDPERLSAAGYAEFHPVADNSTEDGRRLNRRVDIVIITSHQSPPATAAANPQADAAASPAPAGPALPVKKSTSTAD